MERIIRGQFGSLSSLGVISMMQFNYLRLKIYGILLRPFSEWSRKKRMRLFLQKCCVKEGMSILDLGGQLGIWRSVPFKLKLTILNLPGGIEAQGHDANPSNDNLSTFHDICYVEGDACNVTEFENHHFDIVFSNSVIEHVGSAEKRARFAREVRRLGRSYWVQTPSRWFPLEPHTGMVFWWFYPDGVRKRLIRRWHNILPGNPWTRYIEETTVLSKRELIELFPDATIVVERLFGIPKSYVAYKNDQLF